MANKIDAEKIVKVGGLIAHNFLSVLISKETLEKLGDFYPNVESRKLAKEWFALQMFLMVIAISSYFKDNPEGIEISKVFRKCTVEGLVEAGIYETKGEATKFLKERLDIYGKASNKQENYLLGIAIQYSKYIEQYNPELFANIGEQISTFLKSNSNLIKTIDAEEFEGR